MFEKLCSILHDDTHYEKGALNMRTQRCFAIRSGMNGMYVLFIVQILFMNTVGMTIVNDHIVTE